MRIQLGALLWLLTLVAPLLPLVGTFAIGALGGRSRIALRRSLRFANAAGRLLRLGAGTLLLLRLRATLLLLGLGALLRLDSLLVVALRLGALAAALLIRCMHRTTGSARRDNVATGELGGFHRRLSTHASPPCREGP